MPASQPLDIAPDLSNTDLVGAWLNTTVRGRSLGTDASPAGNDGTVAGKPTSLPVGAILDGVDDTIDFGDVGNIQQVSMWVNPDTTTEQLFLADAGNYAHLVAGTVTYVGLTPAATYVNGAAGTTLAAGEWSLVVMQFAQIDADNFELGVDGAGNFGAMNVKDLQARDGVWSASRAAYEYARGVPDDALRLHLLGGKEDLTRYRADFTPVADTIVGHEMAFDGTGDYQTRTAANWRSVDSLGTVCAWVYCGDLTKGMAIFASCDVGTDNYIFEWAVTNAGVQFVYVYEAGGVVGSATGTTGIRLDAWDHLVLTSDGSNYLFYVNGVLDTLAGGGTDSGAWLAGVTLRDNVTIGGLVYNSGLILPWEDKLRDVRYYSDVKSADWIADYYARMQKYY